MSGFSGVSAERYCREFVYVSGAERGDRSYSKIKVVRYHTMDLADSPQNSDAFGHEKAF